MDKQQIEKDLKLKNNELAILQANVLSEVQKKQKEQLEKDIKELQKQLDEFEKLEKNTQTNQTKKETILLNKDIIDVERVDIQTLIQDSVMEKKLETVVWSKEKVKEFSENIHKVIIKYLDQELEWFSENSKNNMSIGIQFAMMETLIKQWAEWSAEFFDSFSSVKSKSATKAFEWLYTSFGKLWTANEFFVLANKVQNLVWYISDKKSSLGIIDTIPELINPSKFTTLLKNPVWSNQAQIDKFNITTILTLNSSSKVDVHAWDDQLKAIVNNPALAAVITEKTIPAIQKSLKTADKLLDNRGKFQDKATVLVDKIAGFLDINIPFLWNLGEMLGMKFPTDILGEQKDGWVLNFVLGVLGFRGGLKWLHKKYIQEKLDEIKIDNTFVAAAYAAYQKNIDSTITHDSDKSIWKLCTLTAPDPKTETAMKDKIPADYAGIKKSMVENLKTAKLNPTMVAKFAPGLVTIKNKESIIDMTQITGKEEEFIDQYLKYIIPLLADPTDDFITSKKIDKSSFVLALIWGLVGDKYFIEWVNIGLLSANDFKDTTKISTEIVNQWNMDVINGKIDFSKWNFTPEQIKNINYLIDEMKKKGITNPYTQVGILSCISKESFFTPVNEFWYGTTPNVRIREIFGARVSKYSDDELTTLKKDNEKFFDAVYGKDATKALWWETGNTEVGDGYKYRGRGFNGITFKALYKQYGDLIWEDLVTNPDLLNRPDIAAKVALEFFKKGNKWEDLSTLVFMNKEAATKKFTDINAWGHANNYSYWRALAAAGNFDVKLAA